MVMIFTVSITVHVVSYYDSARKEGAVDPLGAAVKGTDPQLQDAASRSLGEWMSVDAAPDLTFQRFNERRAHAFKPCAPRGA